jgi:hypothetical protein
MESDELRALLMHSRTKTIVQKLQVNGIHFRQKTLMLLAYASRSSLALIQSFGMKNGMATLSCFEMHQKSGCSGLFRVVPLLFHHYLKLFQVVPKSLNGEILVLRMLG